ncbi:MAG TPA: AraC family transcriptional regulator [Bryobacteraceae bacterium]|nr:AraC family transcriptional regulator [Bryobacteraceae bacterium]
MRTSPNRVSAASSGAEQSQIVQEMRSATEAVHVALRRTLPGIVSFAPTSNHLLRIHAGGPVRGQCSSSVFEYRRGDLDLFPAGMSDTWHEHDESTFLVVQLPQRILHEAAQDSGRKGGEARLSPRHHFRDEQTEHIAWALEAEQRAGNPTGRAYTDALGFALSFRLLSEEPAVRERAGVMTPRQMKRVTEYIEENLDRGLSLTELAAVAGVSLTRLKTAFRNSAGIPVHRFVLERRVARAKAMLLRGGVPIPQVALETGFSHQSHMARWMRRFPGQTPSDLVRSAQA